jgi:hypothetical protein
MFTWAWGDGLLIGHGSCVAQVRDVVQDTLLLQLLVTWLAPTPPPTSTASQLAACPPCGTACEACCLVGVSGRRRCSAHSPNDRPPLKVRGPLAMGQTDRPPFRQFPCPACVALPASVRGLSPQLSVDP